MVGVGGIQIINKGNRRLLKDVAYEKIKEKILESEEVYTSEKELVEMLGMSRTPVREALFHLEHEGFIQIISNQGILIKELSMKERTDLYDMRIAIETYSLKKSMDLINEKHIQRLKEFIEEQRDASEKGDFLKFIESDAKFHQFLLEIFGNSAFISMYNNARERLFTLRDSKYVISRKEVINTLIIEHEALIEHLINQEEELAVELLAEHIEKGKRNYYS